MRKLMIIDAAIPFAQALEDVFKNEFELLLCHDGESALEALLAFRPDALILNLMLPYKDGLTLLQETAFLPKTILAITPYVNQYIEQAAANAGVQYLMIMPTVQSLRVRLMDMLANPGPSKENLMEQASVHLHALGFHTHLDGYHQLCVGIPLFAKNTGARLSKELYPAIAKHFRLPDCRTVEHSIRKAIQTAWKRKDPLVWAKYFPPDPDGKLPCPTNKAFLCQLAEHLEL